VAPDLTGHARFLITTAARAPSVHNTQPWQLRARLALPGSPQMLMQLGRAADASATARREPDELADP
jgi:hypothetical protein